MDINCIKSSVQTVELAMDASFEQSIDCDALLPEFCPDVARVLKCAVKPGLSSVEKRGKVLDLAGLAEINVYYVSNAGGIHCATYKVPFNKTCDLKLDTNLCATRVNAFPVFASCRAVNQRRLDIRAALGLCVQIVSAKDEPVISAVQEDNIHILEAPLQLVKLSDEISTELRISEDLEQSDSKPPVSDILHTQLCTHITSVSPSGSSFSVKGDAELVVFYRTDDGTYDTLEYSLPFSTSISANIENSSTAHISDRILMYSCELKSDNSGLLEIDAAIELSLVVESLSEINVCTDAFSTKSSCKLSYMQTGFCTECKSISERVRDIQTLECDESISQILYSWCEPMDTSYSYKENSLVFSLPVNICMLCCGNDGEIFYLEKKLTTQATSNQSNSNQLVLPQAKVCSCKVNIKNGGIEVELDSYFNAKIFCEGNKKLVSGIELSESSTEKPIPRGLYIYRPSEEESLWDIAKLYMADPEMLCKENEDNNDDFVIIPVI